ncbi:SCO-spondin-like [Trichoplusia ni]|uniref:SCO-spondin-like n=1 Tax=Trichoplusia ni TaxID=7111 RepID=A0A7E5VMK2_TRINI|nr:SCO-spondin-like [Trichoplusia ni]
MLRLLIVLVSCSTAMSRQVDKYDAESANCRPDEEYEWIYPCPGEETCITRDDRLLCLEDIQYKVPHCICKEGLYRAENGSCYNSEQCDKWKCPGDHEHFECASECDNVCATLDRQNKTNCPIRRYVHFDICSIRCYCDDGYARDDKGNCIPIEDCGNHTTTEESNL